MDPRQAKELQPMPLKTRLLLVGGAVGTVVLIVVFMVVCIETTKPDSSEMNTEQIVNSALEAMPIIDGHNNFPWTIRQLVENKLALFNFTSNLNETLPWSNYILTRTDLPRLREGKVGGVFWTANVECEGQNKYAVAHTLEQIDVVHRLIERYDDELSLAKTSRDIRAAMDGGKIASLIGVSSGHSIQSSIAVLRMFYQLGVRYLSLTSTCNTPWAESSSAVGNTESYRFGLTPFGNEMVLEMNRIGMIIDLSYASRDTAVTVLQTSKAPVIFSRSASATLCPYHENLDDDLLRLVKNKRSLVMVPVDIHAVDCNKTQGTIEGVAEHINYIKEVVSIDNVGIGSNFDSFSEITLGLEDPASFPRLFEHLVDNYNWTQGDLEKLSGRNFLRLFEEVERIRGDLSETETGESLIGNSDLVNHNVSLECLFPSVSPLSV